MLARNPFLALVLTTMLGIGIVIALYLALNDPGPPPETEEERFERVHTVFIEALAGGAAWSGRVEVLGLQASRTAAHTPGWQISGTGGACDSSGSYIVHDQPANALAITAPHSQSDALTGELAQLLFEDTAARAVAWNTAPRRVTEECGEGVDLTGERWHPFSAFASAFADANREALMVQLHGYEDSDSAADTGMLIGIANGASQNRLAAMTQCMSGAIAPREARLVSGGAARTNAQGRILRNKDAVPFAYLELSEALRTELVEDTVLRSKFATCLIDGASN